MRHRIDRRRVVAGAAAAAVIGSARGVGAQSPAPAAPSAQFEAAWREAFGTRQVRQGRVHLDLPRLAENGHSVPVKITVESTMSEADHVRVLHILSEQNPIAVVARFHLGPRSGRAEVATMMRLATTQNVHAVAEMSDASLWSAKAESVVLLAACLDGG